MKRLTPAFWTTVLASVLLLHDLGALASPQSGTLACIDFEGEVVIGVTFELNIDVGTWLELRTFSDHVYRAVISGPDGATFDLWSTEYDEGGACDVLDERMMLGEISDGRADLEWPSAGTTALWLKPPADGEMSIFTVDLQVIAAPPDRYTWIIPAVAHAPGAKGTFFRTDLWLSNNLNATSELTLTLVPGDGGGELSASVSLAPLQTTIIRDVVASLFDRHDTVGALRVYSLRPFDALRIVSRTYNTRPDGGTYGQLIAAQPWALAARPGDDQYLLLLAGSDDFRTNLGFVEVLGLDAELEVTLVDSTGATIGGGPVGVPANSHVQINDVFEHFDIPETDRAAAIVTLTNNARVFSYASMIDSHSSDSTFVPALSASSGCPWPDGGCTSTKLVFPAAAATPGAFGSLWRTDLRVLALEAGLQVEIRFIPDAGAPRSRVFDLDDHGLLFIDDVVTDLGGSGSGVLYVSSEQWVVATSRTYNTTADGTFGQLIPAEITYPTPAILSAVGIEGSADVRTNVGIVNPYSESSIEAVIWLVSSDGLLLGSRWVEVAPEHHLQLNDLFKTLRVPGQDSCQIVIELITPYLQGKGLIGYASIIDNRSGDPVYVPATSPLLFFRPRIELDNRRNAVLIDQLPGAVGVEELPAGTFSATVSGAGNLGGPSEPIQVLCLFKSPAGQLSSAAVPIGGSFDGIGGGHRLWCVIPDWSGDGDNSGAVTVTVSGRDQVLKLELDARTNSVELDRLLPSVTVDRPAHGSYRLEVSGDLGAEYLPPRVVALYRTAFDGSLQVRSLGHGDRLFPVDGADRLVIAVVDWLYRDDNTGTTAVVPD